MKVYGWDAVKLADAYSFEELTELQRQVSEQHANPKDEHGHPVGTIYLLDKAGRRKTDAISWAVTYKLQEARRAA